MPQFGGHLSLLVNVVLACDRDVSVPQCLACCIDPKFVADPAAVLLAERVQREIPFNSVLAQPPVERCENSLAPIMRVASFVTRRNLRRDHKSALGIRVEISKHLKHFRVVAAAVG